MREAEHPSADRAGAPTLSCGRAARERRGLDELLQALPFTPRKVFAGTLDIPQLYTLIEGAALHLSGGTGSMHLALLAGTPSVSWFSAFAKHQAWAPQGAQHAVVYSTTPPRDHLHGVDTDTCVSCASSEHGTRSLFQAVHTTRCRDDSRQPLRSTPGLERGFA